MARRIYVTLPHQDCAAVAEWKERLSPKSSLSSDYDGRTLSAILKRVKRLRKNEVTKADGNTLNNYYQYLVVLQALEEETIDGCSDEEYRKAIDALMTNKEKVEPFTKALIFRRCWRKGTKEIAFATLDKVDMFSTKVEPFDFNAPRLVDCELPMKEALSNFRTYVWKDLIVPLVEGGQDAKDSIINQCEIILQKYGPLDTITFDSVHAACLTDTKHAAKATIALGRNGIHAQAEAIVLRKSLLGVS